MMDIFPKVGQRSFITGTTGCGKTHFMLRAIKPFIGVNQIQILDSKEDKSILSLGAPVVTYLGDITKYPFPEYPIVIYAPRGAELSDKKVLDAYCEWIYLRGNTVAVLDELTQVTTSTFAPPGFLDLYTRGRSHGITVLAGNQRPRGIPPIVYTEAENVYKFLLNDENDRKRVAEFTHPAMKLQVSDPHGFHFYTREHPTKIFYIKSL